jgi:hypothetical protein
MTDDHITMHVPATAASTPLFRVAAAQVAAQCGGDYDRVEDVRIAVSEEIRVLFGTPGVEGRGSGQNVARLDAAFTVGADSLTVVVGLDGTGDLPGTDADTERILDATTTSYRIDATRGDSPAVTVHFDMGTSSGAVRDRTPGREH